MAINHRITYADLKALGHSGHDKFLPSLTMYEVQFLLKSIEEHYAANEHVTQTAVGQDWPDGQEPQGGLRGAVTRYAGRVEANSAAQQIEGYMNSEPGKGGPG